MTRLLDNKRLPSVLLGVAMLCAIPLIVHFERGIGITRDEWQFILHRNSLSPRVLISAFNGHFMPLTTVFLKVDQAIFGQPARWPLAIASIVAHLAVVWLLYVYMRSRVGEWWAAAGAVLILFFGTGYELIVWPFNFGWLTSIAAGMAAVIVFERDDSTKNRVYAALLLALSFSGNNNGAVFALAIATGLLYKDSRRKTLAVLTVPFGLFIVWWLLEAGGNGPLYAKEWPGWIAMLVEGTGAGVIGNLGGPAGINSWGSPIALLAIVAIAVEAGRRKSFDLGLATALALPAAFILLITFGRGGRTDPIASRYTYTLLVLALMALAETFRGRKLERAGALIVVAPLLAFCAAGNLAVMAKGADGLRQGAMMDKEYATATLSVGPAIAGKVKSNSGDMLFVPGDTPSLYAWISQPKHRRYAYSPAELAGQPPAIQAAVQSIEKQMRAEAAKAQN